MRPLRSMTPALVLLLALCAGLVPVASRADVIISGPPMAPLPPQPGTGLCSAASASRDPASDFPQHPAGYNAGINAFLEAHADERVTSVLRTPFDLSNNHTAGTRASYGDFSNPVLGCPTGGCGFAFNDTVTAFATRLRGFIAVTEDRVSKPLHFGFYADDSVSLTVFDGQQRAYPIILRPPQLGFPTWRTTNTVVFQRAGLYAIEVLHAQVSEHAALELSLLEGTFTDFERPVNQPPEVSLEREGFRLATSELFHQTESGRAPFSNLARCVQCGRQSAGQSGNGGCGEGYRCNAAALCSPCDTDLTCGTTCSPCGTQAPFCVSGSNGFACAQCRQASDCPAPDACHTSVCGVTGTCEFPAVEDGTGCEGGVCRAGACEPFAVDAGSAPDAGALDAGGVDLDAGSPDVDGGDSEGDAGAPEVDAGAPEVDGGGLDADAGGDLTDAGLEPGSPDGSVPGTDGGSTGTPGGADAGAGSDGGSGPPGDAPPESGCGCGAGTSSLAPMALLGFAFLARRRGRGPA